MFYVSSFMFHFWVFILFKILPCPKHSPSNRDTEHDAGDNVGGPMNACGNARKAHKHGTRRKRICETVRPEKVERAGKSGKKRDVSRRERIVVSLWEKEVSVRKVKERPRSGNDVFY